MKVLHTLTKLELEAKALLRETEIAMALHAAEILPTHKNPEARENIAESIKRLKKLHDELKCDLEVKENRYWLK